MDGGAQSITLIHGPSTRVLLLFPYPLLLAVRPSFLSTTTITTATVAFLPRTSPQVVLSTVTSLIPGRQADGRTLKPCSQRAFPIFHLRSVPGGRIPSIPCAAFFFPRGLAGIKLLPRRELMFPAVNSSYFSRRVIPAARQPLPPVLSSLRFCSALTRDFLPQRRRSTNGIVY